ncbi:MAG: hypothetical protein VW685_02230, partial [Ilumatobacter sp.]
VCELGQTVSLRVEVPWEWHRHTGSALIHAATLGANHRATGDGACNTRPAARIVATVIVLRAAD